MKVLGNLIAAIICGYAYSQVIEHIIQGQIFYKSFTTTAIVMGIVFIIVAVGSFMWGIKQEEG